MGEKRKEEERKKKGKGEKGRKKEKGNRKEKRGKGRGFERRKKGRKKNKKKKKEVFLVRTETKNFQNWRGAGTVGGEGNGKRRRGKG